MARSRFLRVTLAAIGLIGCAGLLNGCIPHSQNDFTEGNGMATDPWTTGTKATPTGTVEPNPSTGAGSYRDIDAKNGVKYP
jgi:hypothetical protein